MAPSISLRHHLFQNTSLILLSLLLLPLNTTILLLSLLYTHLHPAAAPPPSRRTILISGLAMSKGLTLSRLFHRAGHRVIGLDFSTSHFAHSRIPSSGRFSRALSGYYTIPTPTPDDTGRQQYIADLLTIMLREKVDLFVCVSGVATTVEDALVKAFVEKAGCAGEVFQLEPETCAVLHEKDSFIEKCGGVGLEVPVTKVVRGHAETLQRLEELMGEGGGKRFILKSVWLDDVSRGDMTLLPFEEKKDTEAFVNRLEMSEDKPWVLQEFVGGGEEYCTHAVVVRGKVTAFVCCESSDMLMRYRALAADDPRTMRMLAFTKKLVGALENGKLTGQVSVDFLAERDEAGRLLRLLPIESNPRTHTAVVLLKNEPERLANAYLALLERGGGAKEEGDGEVVGPTDTRTTWCWMGHEVVVEVLLPLLEVVRGRMAVEKWVREMARFVGECVHLRDATFEVQDPMPWWWLYHVYYPWFFVRSLWEGRRWTRVNVSTTRVFETY